jgi:hypothetical protein
VTATQLVMTAASPRFVPLESPQPSGLTGLGSMVFKLLRLGSLSLYANPHMFLSRPSGAPILMKSAPLDVTALVQKQLLRATSQLSPDADFMALIGDRLEGVRKVLREALFASSRLDRQADTVSQATEVVRELTLLAPTPMTPPSPRATPTSRRRRRRTYQPLSEGGIVPVSGWELQHGVADALRSVSWEELASVREYVLTTLEDVHKSLSPLLEAPAGSLTADAFGRSMQFWIGCLGESTPSKCSKRLAEVLSLARLASLPPSFDLALGMVNLDRCATREFVEILGMGIAPREMTLDASVEQSFQSAHTTPSAAAVAGGPARSRSFNVVQSAIDSLDGDPPAPPTVSESAVPATQFVLHPTDISVRLSLSKRPRDIARPQQIVDVRFGHLQVHGTSSQLRWAFAAHKFWQLHQTRRRYRALRPQKRLITGPYDPRQDRQSSFERSAVARQWWLWAISAAVSEHWLQEEEEPSSEQSVLFSSMAAPGSVPSRMSAAMLSKRHALRFWYVALYKRRLAGQGRALAEERHEESPWGSFEDASVFDALMDDSTATDEHRSGRFRRASGRRKAAHHHHHHRVSRHLSAVEPSPLDEEDEADSSSAELGSMTAFETVTEAEERDRVRRSKRQHNRSHGFLFSGELSRADSDKEGLSPDSEGGGSRRSRVSDTGVVVRGRMGRFLRALPSHQRARAEETRLRRRMWPANASKKLYSTIEGIKEANDLLGMLEVVCGRAPSRWKEWAAEFKHCTSELASLPDTDDEASILRADVTLTRIDSKRRQRLWRQFESLMSEPAFVQLSKHSGPLRPALSEALRVCNPESRPQLNRLEAAALDRLDETLPEDCLVLWRIQAEAELRRDEALQTMVDQGVDVTNVLGRPGRLLSVVAASADASESDAVLTDRRAPVSRLAPVMEATSPTSQAVPSSGPAVPDPVSELGSGLITIPSVTSAVYRLLFGSSEPIAEVAEVQPKKKSKPPTRPGLANLSPAQRQTLYAAVDYIPSEVPTAYPPGYVRIVGVVRLVSLTTCLTDDVLEPLRQTPSTEEVMFHPLAHLRSSVTHGLSLVPLSLQQPLVIATVFGVFLRSAMRPNSSRMELAVASLRVDRGPAVRGSKAFRRLVAPAVSAKAPPWYEDACKDQRALTKRAATRRQEHVASVWNEHQLSELPAWSPSFHTHHHMDLTTAADDEHHGHTDTAFGPPLALLPLSVSLSGSWSVSDQARAAARAVAAHTTAPGAIASAAATIRQLSRDREVAPSGQQPSVLEGAVVSTLSMLAGVTGLGIGSVTDEEDQFSNAEQQHKRAETWRLSESLFFSEDDGTCGGRFPDDPTIGLTRAVYTTCFFYAAVEVFPTPQGEELHDVHEAFVVSGGVLGGVAGVFGETGDGAVPPQEYFQKPYPRGLSGISDTEQDDDHPSDRSFPPLGSSTAAGNPAASSSEPPDEGGRKATLSETEHTSDAQPQASRTAASEAEMVMSPRAIGLSGDDRRTLRRHAFIRRQRKQRGGNESDAASVSASILSSGSRLARQDGDASGMFSTDASDADGRPPRRMLRKRAPEGGAASVFDGKSRPAWVGTNDIALELFLQPSTTVLSISTVSAAVRCLPDGLFPSIRTQEVSLDSRPLLSKLWDSIPLNAPAVTHRMAVRLDVAAPTMVLPQNESDNNSLLLAIPIGRVLVKSPVRDASPRGGTEGWKVTLVNTSLTVARAFTPWEQPWERLARGLDLIPEIRVHLVVRPPDQHAAVEDSDQGWRLALVISRIAASVSTTRFASAVSVTHGFFASLMGLMSQVARRRLDAQPQAISDPGDDPDLTSVHVPVGQVPSPLLKATRRSDTFLHSIAVHPTEALNLSLLDKLRARRKRQSTAGGGDAAHRPSVDDVDAEDGFESASSGEHQAHNLWGITATKFRESIVPKASASPRKRPFSLSVAFDQLELQWTHQSRLGFEQSCLPLPPEEDLTLESFRPVQGKPLLQFGVEQLVLGTSLQSHDDSFSIGARATVGDVFLHDLRCDAESPLHQCIGFALRGQEPAMDWKVNAVPVASQPRFMVTSAVAIAPARIILVPSLAVDLLFTQAEALTSFDSNDDLVDLCCDLETVGQSGSTSSVQGSAERVAEAPMMGQSSGQAVAVASWIARLDVSASLQRVTVLVPVGRQRWLAGVVLQGASAQLCQVRPLSPDSRLWTSHVALSLQECSLLDLWTLSLDRAGDPLTPPWDARPVVYLSSLKADERRDAISMGLSILPVIHPDEVEAYAALVEEPAMLQTLSAPLGAAQDLASTGSALQCVRSARGMRLHDDGEEFSVLRFIQGQVGHCFVTCESSFIQAALTAWNSAAVGVRQSAVSPARTIFQRLTGRELADLSSPSSRARASSHQVIRGLCNVEGFSFLFPDSVPRQDRETGEFHWSCVPGPLPTISLLADGKQQWREIDSASEPPSTSREVVKWVKVRVDHIHLSSGETTGDDMSSVAVPPLQAVVRGVLGTCEPQSFMFLEDGHATVELNLAHWLGTEAGGDVEHVGALGINGLSLRVSAVHLGAMRDVWEHNLAALAQGVLSQRPTYLNWSFEPSVVPCAMLGSWVPDQLMRWMAPLPRATDSPQARLDPVEGGARARLWKRSLSLLAASEIPEDSEGSTDELSSQVMTHEDSMEEAEVAVRSHRLGRAFQLSVDHVSMELVRGSDRQFSPSRRAVSFLRQEFDQELAQRLARALDLDRSELGPDSSTRRLFRSNLNLASMNLKSDDPLVDALGLRGEDDPTVRHSPPRTRGATAVEDAAATEGAATRLPASSSDSHLSQGQSFGIRSRAVMAVSASSLDVSVALFTKATGVIEAVGLCASLSSFDVAGPDQGHPAVFVACRADAVSAQRAVFHEPQSHSSPTAVQAVFISPLSFEPLIAWSRSMGSLPELPTVPQDLPPHCQSNESVVFLSHGHDPCTVTAPVFGDCRGSFSAASLSVGGIHVDVSREALAAVMSGSQVLTSIPPGRTSQHRPLPHAKIPFPVVALAGIRSISASMQVPPQPLEYRRSHHLRDVPLHAEARGTALLLLSTSLSADCVLLPFLIADTAVSPPQVEPLNDSFESRAKPLTASLAPYHSRFALQRTGASISWFSNDGDEESHAELLSPFEVQLVAGTMPVTTPVQYRSQLPIDGYSMSTLRSGEADEQDEQDLDGQASLQRLASTPGPGRMRALLDRAQQWNQLAGRLAVRHCVDTSLSVGPLRLSWDRWIAQCVASSVDQISSSRPSPARNDQGPHALLSSFADAQVIFSASARLDEGVACIRRDSNPPSEFDLEGRVLVGPTDARLFAQPTALSLGVVTQVSVDMRPIHEPHSSWSPLVPLLPFEGRVTGVSTLPGGKPGFQFDVLVPKIRVVSSSARMKAFVDGLIGATTSLSEAEIADRELSASEGASHLLRRLGLAAEADWPQGAAPALGSPATRTTVGNRPAPLVTAAPRTIVGRRHVRVRNLAPVPLGVQLYCHAFSSVLSPGAPVETGACVTQPLLSEASAFDHPAWLSVSLPGMQSAGMVLCPWSIADWTSDAAKCASVGALCGGIAASLWADEDAAFDHPMLLVHAEGSSLDAATTVWLPTGDDATHVAIRASVWWSSPECLQVDVSVPFLIEGPPHTVVGTLALARLLSDDSSHDKIPIVPPRQSEFFRSRAPSAPPRRHRVRLRELLTRGSDQGVRLWGPLPLLVRGRLSSDGSALGCTLERHHRYLVSQFDGILAQRAAKDPHWALWPIVEHELRTFASPDLLRVAKSKRHREVWGSAAVFRAMNGQFAVTWLLSGVSSSFDSEEAGKNRARQRFAGQFPFKLLPKDGLPCIHTEAHSMSARCSVVAAEYWGIAAQSVREAPFGDSIPVFRDPFRVLRGGKSAPWEVETLVPIPRSGSQQASLAALPLKWRCEELESHVTVVRAFPSLVLLWDELHLDPFPELPSGTLLLDVRKVYVEAFPSRHPPKTHEHRVLLPQGEQVGWVWPNISEPRSMRVTVLPPTSDGEEAHTVPFDPACADLTTPRGLILPLVRGVEAIGAVWLKRWVARGTRCLCLCVLSVDVLTRMTRVCAPRCVPHAVLRMLQAMETEPDPVMHAEPHRSLVSFRKGSAAFAFQFHQAFLECTPSETGIQGLLLEQQVTDAWFAQESHLLRCLAPSHPIPPVVVVHCGLPVGCDSLLRVKVSQDSDGANLSSWIEPFEWDAPWITWPVASGTQSADWHQKRLTHLERQRPDLLESRLPCEWLRIQVDESSTEVVVPVTAPLDDSWLWADATARDGSLVCVETRAVRPRAAGLPWFILTRAGTRMADASAPSPPRKPRKKVTAPGGEMVPQGTMHARVWFGGLDLEVMDDTETGEIVGASIGPLVGEVTNSVNDPLRSERTEIAWVSRLRLSSVAVKLGGRELLKIDSNDMDPTVEVRNEREALFLRSTHVADGSASPIDVIRVASQPFRVWTQPSLSGVAFSQDDLWPHAVPWAVAEWHQSQSHGGGEVAVQVFPPKSTAARDAPLVDLSLDGEFLHSASIVVGLFADLSQRIRLAVLDASRERSAASPLLLNTVAPPVLMAASAVLPIPSAQRLVQFLSAWHSRTLRENREATFAMFLQHFTAKSRFPLPPDLVSEALAMALHGPSGASDRAFPREECARLVGSLTSAMLHSQADSAPHAKNGLWAFVGIRASTEPESSSDRVQQVLRDLGLPRDIVNGDSSTAGSAAAADEHDGDSLGEKLRSADEAVLSEWKRRLASVPIRSSHWPTIAGDLSHRLLELGLSATSCHAGRVLVGTVRRMLVRLLTQTRSDWLADWVEHHSTSLAQGSSTDRECSLYALFGDWSRRDSTTVTASLAGDDVRVARLQVAPVRIQVRLGAEGPSPHRTLFSATPLVLRCLELFGFHLEELKVMQNLSLQHARLAGVVPSLSKLLLKIPDPPWKVGVVLSEQCVLDNSSLLSATESFLASGHHQDAILCEAAAVERTRFALRKTRDSMLLGLRDALFRALPQWVTSPGSNVVPLLTRALPTVNRHRQAVAAVLLAVSQEASASTSLHGATNPSLGLQALEWFIRWTHSAWVVSDLQAISE